MDEQTTIKPTEAEMEILNILWTHGPAAVKDVHERLSRFKNTGYTTTLKIMQNMLEKKLVSRDAASKVHIYTALADKEQAQGQIVQRMIEKVFNGSAMQLVMQALGNHKASKEELDLIKRYLDQKSNK